MSGPTPDDVRAFVAAFVNAKLQERGKVLLHELPYDYDLSLSGVLDSLALVEMLTGAGERFDGDVDFAELDPEKMTIVGPLCVFLSEQLGRRDG